MKMEALTKAMKTSISDVLETMFFLPIDFAEGADPGTFFPSDRGGILSARLDFSGPLSGCLLFHIPETLATSMTASFMGQEAEGVSREHVGDTVKEILNMVAGNAFGMYDNEAVFDLGIPEIIRRGDIEGHGRQAGEEIFVGINTLEESLAFHLICRI
ncbi:MAG: chemotaxis protein CheX [Deltaproteobacteria bacterium]|nr:chemotaxis protein CheX [Deltaproteobacteria bacterium]